MLLHRKVNTQEGYSGFQVTGMIEWGQKSKPEKITGPKFIPQKISRQATKTNTRQNFPTQKKSRNKKFQTPKNPLIIPVTWNPEYTPPPPLRGVGVNTKFLILD